MEQNKLYSAFLEYYDKNPNLHKIAKQLAYELYVAGYARCLVNIELVNNLKNGKQG